MGVPVAKLNAEHAEYAMYSDAWTNLDTLAAGGARLKQQAQRFLVKRPKELPDVYAERCRRLTYQNILGQALGWYEAALFRRNPELGTPAGSDDFYESFLEDCDRGGKTFVDFNREVFRNLILYRSSWVLTDLPRADSPIDSRADETAAGLDSPYLVNYEPRDVINWSADGAGNLRWVVIKTQTESAEFLEGSRIVTNWLYFDRTEYRKYEYREPEGGDSITSVLGADGKPIGDTREAELVDARPHALAAKGVVPIVRIQVPDTLWLANRIYLLLLEHFDLKNTSSWQLFLTNLPWLVISGEANIENATRSEVSFLHLTDPLAKAFYLQPEQNTFTESRETLAALREECYRTIYLQSQGKSSTATASASSGYSKEMDLMPANDVLNAFGDILRAGMQRTLGNVAAARGEEIEFDVRGFTFETKPATESIAINQEYNALGIPSETAEKTMDKKTLRDVFEDANAEELQKMCDEIDAAPTRLEAAAKQQELEQQQIKASFSKLAGRQAVQAAA